MKIGPLCMSVASVFCVGRAGGDKRCSILLSLIFVLKNSLDSDLSIG